MKNVMAKVAKINKEELSAQKVELALIDDVNKKANTVVEDYRAIAKAIQEINKRKREVRSLMKISSHLVKGFSNQIVGANLLRGSAMLFLDNSFIIKKMFKEKFSYGKN